jgi:hypothetical protein
MGDLRFPHIHRTPEMIAMGAAQSIKHQGHLDELLSQFSPQHHAGIIERLKPHLEFEPNPLEPSEG